MKIKYLIPLLVFALGLGLIVVGTLSSTEITLFGVTFHPSIANALGIFTILFGVSTLLGMLDGSQPPGYTGRRE